MFNLSDEAWGDYPETATPTLLTRVNITAGLTPAQAAAAHDEYEKRTTVSTSEHLTESAFC